MAEIVKFYMQHVKDGPEYQLGISKAVYDALPKDPLGRVVIAPELYLTWKDRLPMITDPTGSAHFNDIGTIAGRKDTLTACVKLIDEAEISTEDMLTLTDNIDDRMHLIFQGPK